MVACGRDSRVHLDSRGNESSVYKNVETGVFEMAETQISAYISEDTKSELETYVKQRGVKKAYVIEEALLHYLQALREIPEDVIIPAKLVLSEKSLAAVAERLAADEEPSEDLKALFAADHDR
jgi:hypothetical protein